jgi:hypothetical protein
MPLELGRHLDEKLPALGRRYRRGGLLDREINGVRNSERHGSHEDQERA